MREMTTIKKITALVLMVSLVLGVIPIPGVGMARGVFAFGEVNQTISAGYYHAVAIKANGELWAWGSNSIGQLGDGTRTDRYSPVKVMDNVASVSAGVGHTMAIKTNGELWAWGDNGYGRLGDNTTTARRSPVKIMDDVASVSAGGYHTMAIKENGELWTWGYNDYGQLGDGTTTDRYFPVKVMDKVASVSAGSLHTMAIKENGELWVWGYNSSGQLGDGTITNRYSPVKVVDNVAYVSVGFDHTMAIKANGELWAWGLNWYGQLGDDTIVYCHSPVKVMDNVASVSAGDYHTMAIKENGELWTWGYNDYGQLGDGTTANRYSPVKIMDNAASVSAGYDHTMAIKENGELWAWGRNRYGQLGDGTTIDRYSPIKVMQLLDSPNNINSITINAQGYGYDNIKLYDTNSISLSNQKLNYSFIGYSGIQTTTTDKNGIAVIKTPFMNESKELTVNITLANNSSTAIKNPTHNIKVTVKPLSFSQEWEAKVSAGLGATAKIGVDGKIGIAEGEASIGGIGVNVSRTNSMKLKNSYKDGIRTLEISSTLDKETAGNLKLGLFADGTIAGQNTTITAGSVGAGASIGEYRSAVLEIEDYNPNDMNDVLSVGGYLLNEAVLMADSNAFTRELLEMFNLNPYNAIVSGTKAKLNANAKLGTFETGADNNKYEASVAGIGATTVFSHSTKKDKDNKTTYGSGIKADLGGAIGYGAKYSTGGMETSVASMFGKDFLNNNTQIKAVIDSNNNLESLSVNGLEKNNNQSIFWDSWNTNLFSELKYEGANAKALSDGKEDIRRFVNGNKGFFSASNMENTVDYIVDSGVDGTYSKTFEEEKGFDIGIALGLTVGLGAELGLGLSGIESYEYESETGIISGNNAFKQSEALVGELVSNNRKELTEIMLEPVNAINNFIASVVNVVSNNIKDGVEYGKAVIKGWGESAANWIVSITSFNQKNRLNRSYAIWAVSGEESSAKALAVTVGEPYIVQVHDLEGNEITDLSSNPLELELYYDDYLLSVAGAGNDADTLKDLKIYRWDKDRLAYVYVGGELDLENQKLTTNITETGQYILAIDNMPPAVTDFKASDNTPNPTISAVVTDLSGISEFLFKIDDKALVTEDNFSEYYDYQSGIFEYAVTADLSEGTHIAFIMAGDTVGNKLDEPVLLEFSVDTKPPVISNIIIPEWVDDINGFEVFATIEDDNLDSAFAVAKILDVYGGSQTIPIEMTAGEEGLWSAKVTQLIEATQLQIYILAVDMAGNKATSEVYTSNIIIPENDSSVYMSILNINKTADSMSAKICIRNKDSADISGELICGIYDSNGRTIKVQSKDVKIKGQEIVLENIDMTVNADDEYEIAFFLWDGLDTMVPLSDKAYIDMPKE